MTLPPVVRKVSSKLTLLTLASSIAVAGCAVHGRVYDPYYHDYHDWHGESNYYLQWEGDTHRHHEDFNHRNAADQKEYWDWRHQHEH